jgi:hypothetical protein
MQTSTPFVRRALAAFAAAIAVACAPDLPTGTDKLAVRDAKGTAGAGATGGSTGIVVSAASPNAAKRDTTLDVRIIGSGFDRYMSAKWALGGVATSEVVVNSTRYVSATELVANITVKSTAQIADYDIVVTSSKTGKPGIGTEKFEVVLETPLATLGGAYTGAVSVNDAGQVAGHSNPPTSGMDHPVMWTAAGVIRDLLPAGYYGGQAKAINSSGQVVGWAVKLNPNVIVPFIWSEATGFKELPSLPGQTNSAAYAINDAGMVAGYSGPSATVWVNGVVSAIVTVPGNDADATGINSQGEVVGHYYVSGGTEGHPFIWRSGTGMQLLTTLDGNRGWVMDINDNGQIAGYGPLPGSTTSYAFVIENGVAKRLSSAALGSTSAYAISRYGDVVGVDAFGRGIIWNVSGSEQVLCTPPVAASGYTSTCGVLGINSSLMAVGYKTDRYGDRDNAYKWTPLTVP